MSLKWKPISELDDKIRPLFLFTPDDETAHASTNVRGGLVWVTGGRRPETGGFRGDHGKENPTHFAEIEGPFDNTDIVLDWWEKEYHSDVSD